MKIVKILCDRCGCEIVGNPFAFYMNEIDRDSGDIADSKIIEKDFCKPCASIIMQDITDAMVLDPEPEPEPEHEPEPEPKIHKGGCVKGQRLLTPSRKETVRQIVLKGKSDEEIAEALDMPVEKIKYFVDREGFRQLVYDKPKKPDPPARTTASGMEFST